jgi:hypothetical protein
MKELSQDINKDTARRKLVFGIGILAFFSFFKLPSFYRRKDAIACAPEKKTIKLLTQDGRLVEVEVSKTNTTKQKITDTGLKNWIKKA